MSPITNRLFSKKSNRQKAAFSGSVVDGHNLKNKSHMTSKQAVFEGLTTKHLKSTKILTLINPLTIKLLIKSIISDQAKMKKSQNMTG